MLTVLLLNLEINTKQTTPPMRMMAVCADHISHPEAVPVVSGFNPYKPNNWAISAGYAPIPFGVKMMPSVPTTRAASPPGNPRYCVSLRAYNPAVDASQYIVHIKAL